MIKKEIKTEIIAGITSFLAAMYIIVVNPAILQKGGMDFSALLTATVLVSSLSTILMGFIGKNPIIVAPGMGLNAFFTYSVILGYKVPVATALGIVFWSGVIFFILMILPLRRWITDSIPQQIRFGIAGGIGLFIAFIGFQNSGLIVADAATLVKAANLDYAEIIFFIGLFFTAFLLIKKVKGALIFGILFTAILSIPSGRIDLFSESFMLKKLIQLPQEGIFSYPDFSLFLQLDLIGSLKFSFIPIIFTFLFTDLFDSLSTFMGVAEAGKLFDKEGQPQHIKEALLVDAISTMMAGLFGSSPGTSYIESAAGIKEGGRFGLTAVVAGILFLPFLFLSPLLAVIPSQATATALVVVGIFMMGSIKKIQWDDYAESLPAFLALILIPLSYSITKGLIFSFLAWTALRVFSGRLKEIPTAIWFIDLFALIALYLGI